MRALLNAFAAASVLLTGSATLKASEPEVLFAGEWRNGGYEIEGAWSIVAEGDATFVVLSNDFKTRRAPDLKIFLSPLDFGELNDRNAIEGAVRVAVLERFRGEQRYEVPGDVDFEELASILIQCEKFSKFWGGAPLRRPAASDQQY